MDGVFIMFFLVALDNPHCDDRLTSEIRYLHQVLFTFCMRQISTLGKIIIIMVEIKII